MALAPRCHSAWRSQARRAQRLASLQPGHRLRKACLAVVAAAQPHRRLGQPRSSSGHPADLERLGEEGGGLVERGHRPRVLRGAHEEGEGLVVAAGEAQVAGHLGRPPGAPSSCQWPARERAPRAALRGGVPGARRRPPRAAERGGSPRARDRRAAGRTRRPPPRRRQAARGSGAAARPAPVRAPRPRTAGQAWWSGQSPATVVRTTALRVAAGPPPRATARALSTASSGLPSAAVTTRPTVLSPSSAASRTRRAIAAGGSDPSTSSRESAPRPRSRCSRASASGLWPQPPGQYAQPGTAG